MIKNLRQHPYQFTACILIGFSWAYSLSTHYLNFFQEPKIIKLEYITVLTIVFCISAFLILRYLVPFLLTRFTHLFIRIVLILTIAFAFSFLFFNYQITPFLTNHTLKIITGDLQSDRIPAKHIEIRNIYYSNLGRSASIPVEDLNFGGFWEIDGNTYVTNEQNASITFQKEMSGGVTIVFRSNSTTGKVQINWDENIYNLDTHEFIETETEIILPATSWGSPRITWSIMAVVMVISDILSILSISFLISTLFLFLVQQLVRIRIPLLLFAFFLFMLNLIGVFASMRNSEVADRIWRFEQVLSIIKQPAPTREERLYVLTESIHYGMLNNWDNNNIEKYNLRVPIYENYILFFQRWNLKPGYHRKYEFVDYKKALERGVGLCSQQSVILFDILQRENIPAKIFGLQGHVMVTAQSKQDTWWVLDPDYGVIIQHDLAELINNPELIRPYYVQKGCDVSTIDVLVKIFSKGEITFYGTLAAYFDSKLIENEKRSYIMIWVYPVLLALPYIYSFFQSYFIIKKNKTTEISMSITD